MSNILSLIKINLLSIFNINKFNKKKKRTIGALIGVVSLVYLAILAFVTIYMFIFEGMFVEAGQNDLILLMGIVITSFITLFATVSKANAYIFRTKDYDLLMSLPIKNSEIIISKIISLYLYNLTFAFTILISIFIAYSIFTGFNIVLLLMILLVIVIAPLFPMAVGSFISFLLGYIPLKQKTKNILSTVLYLIFFIPFIILYAGIMNKSDAELLSQVHVLNGVFEKSYFLGYWAFLGITNLDIIKLLLFISISLVSIIIFIALVSKFFITYNSMNNRVEVNKNFSLSKEKYESSSSDTKTLFLKEVRNYLNIPMYIMNTIVGPIISIIGTIVICSQLEGIMSGLGPEDPIAPGSIPQVLMFFVIIALLGSISITSTTTSSISLEGKNFWILKAAPIKTSAIFTSKILVNIMITVPVIIVDAIIASIYLKPGILFTLSAIIIPSIYAVTFSVSGLYFNILLPKFDYDNPIKVIKQGIPILINMVVSIVIVIVVLISYILFANILGISIALVIEIFFSMLFLVFAILILCTHGVKKFEKIDA